MTNKKGRRKYIDVWYSTGNWTKFCMTNKKGRRKYIDGHILSLSFIKTKSCLNKRCFICHNDPLSWLRAKSETKNFPVLKGLNEIFHREKLKKSLLENFDQKWPINVIYSWRHKNWSVVVFLLHPYV